MGLWASDDAHFAAEIMALHVIEAPFHFISSLEVDTSACVLSLFD